MLKEKEQIIYPGHGLAIVKEFVDVDGEGFVKLEFPYRKHMQILVPVNGLQTAGIRHVSNQKTIEKVIEVLSSPASKDCDDDPSNGGRQTWKKKQRIYKETIACGKLLEIASMYRDLYNAARLKDLPFGEKDLLNKVEALVCQEIYAAKKMDCGVELFSQKLRKVIAKEIKPKDLGLVQL